MTHNIDTKNEPSRFHSLADILYDVTKFSKHYFIWLLLRKQDYYGKALKNRARVDRA